jgi:ABC-type transport system involved in multi-copper enzyme maturation permease subunit
MRPYLAIIKDSFREAWRSWALWVVLVLITLFLIALAPVGASREAVVGVGPLELLERDGQRFLLEIGLAGESDEATPAKAIFDRLDPKTQKRVLDVVKKIVTAADEESERGPVPPSDAGVAFEVREELDEMLREPGFYEQEDWRRVNLRSEAFELKAQGLENLDEARIARFNRVALESAFPDLFFRTPPRGYVFSYLVWELNPDNALPVTEKDFADTVAFWLRGSMNWVFGSLGILIALIVTAPMVPQTFDPGALNLLLSKPVSRFGTLIAKYLGGCAFVTICVAYLVSGMTLLLGLRLGIWDWTYLYYVPIFVFVFAIYHSVSVTAGIIFRSTIVSICLVFLFWTTCFALGWAKSWVFDPFLVVPVSASELIRSGEETFAVTRTGAVYRRNDATDEWERIFLSTEDPGFAPINWRLGPTHDPSRDALFGQRGFGFQVDQMLSYATKSGAWRRKTGPNIGLGAQKLLYRPEMEAGEGDEAKTVPAAMLFVSADGPAELREDPLAEKEASALSFLSRFAAASVFEPRIDEPLELELPIAVALHEASGDLAIYSNGELLWLSLQPDGSYQTTLRERLKELEEDEMDRVAFDVGGPKEAPLVAIAREDGSITPIRIARGADAKAEALPAFSPEGESIPRTVRVRPDGSQIAILFHVGTLWFRDVESGELDKPWIAGQGNLTAVSWFGDDDLAVADNRTGARVLDAGSYSLRERIDMPSNFWISIYRWGVLPAYTILPKPGEIDQTMYWLQTGDETEPANLIAQISPSLDTPRTKLNPFAPLWTGLLFIGLMLAFGGWYFSRQEY